MTGLLAIIQIESQELSFRNKRFFGVSVSPIVNFELLRGRTLGQLLVGLNGPDCYGSRFAQKRKHVSVLRIDGKAQSIFG